MTSAKDLAERLRELVIGYTNWRGEFSVRRLEPRGIRFGSTEWHPEDQWLLRALDLDKCEEREFAFRGFGNSDPTLLTRLAALGEPDADLVKRLRELADKNDRGWDIYRENIFYQAADTIDHLNLKLAEANAAREAAERALVEKRRDRIGDSEISGSYLCRAERAEARLATVEAALKQIRDFPAEKKSGDDGVSWSAGGAFHHVQSIARAALHPEGQKEGGG